MAAVGASFVLASCGGASHTTSSSASPPAPDPPPVSASALPAAPEGVVARVGPYTITQAAYNHAFAAEVDSEPSEKRAVPVPPDFTACISHLKAAATAGAPTSRASLKQECQKQYESLKERALDRLITNEWVIGAAKEIGFKVPEGAVEQNIAEFKRRNFPTEKKLHAYLLSIGQTLGDLIFQTRVEFSAEAIRRAIKRKVGSFPQARIVNYYDAHKSRYVVPENRDLQIVRTDTRAQALGAKREIASGKSFASVVKKLGLKQPIFSKEGLVLGLKSGVYSEPVLNTAIFTAHLNKLSGPVHISLGYYVFQVKRVHARRQKSLAEVEAGIKSKLPEKLQEQALAAYVAAWRARWSARTSCAPGYVVRRCKQYRVTASSPPDDAYTLD